MGFFFSPAYMCDEFGSDARPGFTSESNRHNGSAERMTTDEVHRLLASERRRLLLTYLAKEADGVVPFDDLVDAIAERERPGPGPATHRDRVVADLYHVHLPKLADAEVIEYDPVEETVEYRASGRFKALLDVSSYLEEEEE